MLNTRFYYADRMMRFKPRRNPVEVIKADEPKKIKSVNHDKPVLKLKICKSSPQ